MRMFFIVCLFFITNAYAAFPGEFVYLHDIDPTIVEDIRYAGFHNFVGRPVNGYENGRCIITRQAALALAKIQKVLQASSLSLKVYDCYRPTQAVEDFMAWSKEKKEQQMKREFYPHVNKLDFFRLGYVAQKSGHSRGSTVDVTIIPMPLHANEDYRPGQKLIACTASYLERYHDNSLDMGTGFDCMDELSFPSSASISKTASKNRMLLRQLMVKYGFLPYDKEWWHFTLQFETYPTTYFNFPIT